MKRMTKSEYRNAKQIRTTDTQNGKEQANPVVSIIRILNFLPVSNFGFRISDFT